jgi:hypothetical protein
MSRTWKIDRREFCRATAALAIAGSTAGRVDAAEPSRLSVATFRSEVTPPLGSPSYPSFGPLATVEHPLWAKGVVLDDGVRRYVLCAVDWCVLSNSARLHFRQQLATAAGTDVAAVAVQMVHQHTAPLIDTDAQSILDTVDDAPPYLDTSFLDGTFERLGAAVRASLDSLKPVDRVGAGQADVERVASSRRIITADGKLHGRMSSTHGRPELRELPEGLIDPKIKTVTLASGDTPVARLHYYATHPQSFYGDRRVSFDFPGMAREQLEQEEGVFQVYFTGCAGDVAAGKYNDGSPDARQDLADRLLAGMKAAVAATQWEAVEWPLTWRTTPVLLPPKLAAEPSEAGLFSLRGLHPEQLRSLMNNPKETANSRIGAARRLAFLQRSDQPIELSALKMGRVYLVHLPGEPMVEFQLDAQRQRPDHFVAVAGYGEGCTNYICTAEAFEQGGYEPSAASVGPGAEQILKAGIRRVLGLG